MPGRRSRFFASVFVVVTLLLGFVGPVGASAQPVAPPAPPTAPPTIDIPASDVSPFAERVFQEGFSMSDGGEVYSIDGRTMLFMNRGLLQVWVDNSHKWTAGQSSGGNVVRFQTDGNLVVYSGSNAVWASNTSWACGNVGITCYLVISDNGNVFIRDWGGFLIWQTGTAR